MRTFSLNQGVVCSQYQKEGVWIEKYSLLIILLIMKCIPSFVLVWAQSVEQGEDC